MIGNKIKKLREQRGMTQEQLAKLVSLSQQTVDHYEKGRARPSIDTVNLLADIFSVSTDYLLGRTDVPNPHQKTASNDLIDVSNLDDELKKDAEKYIEWLRVKQTLNPSTEETSAGLDPLADARKKA